MISKIKVVEKRKLQIEWHDGSESIIQLANLRNICPCAECFAEREERGKKYIPIFNDEQLSVQDIQIVGNYALTIIWKDGHNTGIYEFDYLKRITE